MNILWDNILKAKTLVKIAAKRSEGKPEAGIKYGWLTSFLLMAGFTCINALHIKGAFYLFPSLYFLFLTPGIYYSLWKLSPTGKSNSIPYFEGLKTGSLTAFVAALAYAIFAAFYIAANKESLTFVNESRPFSSLLEPFSAALSLFFEGLAFGITITFCLMQYFKKD